MLEVMYEEREFIVVVKPVGIESQSSRGFESDMVSEIKRYIHNSSPTAGEPYVGVIHRLDKPVSGIMVYAKTKNAAAALSKQAADGRMKKKYLAVVCGKPVDKVDNFVDYLLKDRKTNCSHIVDKCINGGKIAKLRFLELESRVVEPYGELSLLEVELLTGRHHQIRAQMAGHGLPLWGDQKYNPAFGDPKAPVRRAGEHVALSSCELGFLHPDTGQYLMFSRKPQGKIFQYFQYCRDEG